jgi:hypothetical protein
MLRDDLGSQHSRAGINKVENDHLDHFSLDLAEDPYPET